MSQYPEQCTSRIETSLPPVWKRSYTAHHSEDDDSSSDGPEPLIHHPRHRHRHRHRARERHSETPNRHDVDCSRTRVISRPPPPLPPRARQRESHISYPAAPIHAGVKIVRARVARAKSPEVGTHEERFELSEDAVIKESSTSIDYDYDIDRSSESQSSVELYKRPVYSEATYSDSDDEYHCDIFYSFGDSINSGGRRGSQLDGASISDIESTVIPDEGNEDSPDLAERGAAAYHILESQYAGDGYEAGHHSVQLTAVLSERAPVSQSLYRWIHFSRPSMDIDDFAMQVATIPGLSNRDKNELQKVIMGVKRDHAKTVQASDGKYARYLEPKLRHEPLMQDGKPVGSRAVTWVSLPYFSLEPYSGLLDTANSPKSLATPTLLQARYSRTTRVRDMEQAVCQQGGAPKGHCFHVSQLWCLVLDNSLLLTYGRITEEALCGGVISKTVLPLHNPPDPMPSKALSVRYRGSVIWSIPVKECETWFGFISHFRNYHPWRLRFFYQSTAIKPQSWPKFYRLAVRPDRKLVLDVHVGGPFAPPPTHASVLLSEKDEGAPGAPLNKSLSATLSPNHDNQTPSDSAMSPVPTGTQFSCGIFAYSECFDNIDPSLANPPAPAISSSSSSPKPPPSFRNVAVIKYFADMERHIDTRTIPEDRRAYRDTAKVQRADVYKFLVTKKATLASATTTSNSKRDFEKRVSVFNSADIVFNFFFPAGVRVSTIRKFWGAVMAIVDTESPMFESRMRNGRYRSRPSSQLGELAAALRSITTDILAFNETIAKIEEADRAHIRTPSALINGWIHIILALATFPSNSTRSLQLARRAESDISSGVNEVIEARSERLRLKNLVVLPFDLLSLISMKLSRDVTPGLPDISSTYGSYLNTIESDIVTKHSDRRIEHKLGLLQQELSIIDWTVELQRNILSKMVTTRESVTRSVDAQFCDEKETVRRPTFPWLAHRLTPRHPTMAAMAEGILESNQPCGFSYMLLGEGLRELAVKRNELKLMGDLVAHLAETNRNQIDYTKDRQERAIYAFTIVTVIFLPLSAVASIFGMNSSDVRDMDLGQWAYWATAVPVTALVVFLGLLFTGELGTVARWMGDIFGGGGVGGRGARKGRWLGNGEDGWLWERGDGTVEVVQEGFREDDEWERVGRREKAARKVRGGRRRRR